jgi:hypothetical protein
MKITKVLSVLLASIVIFSASTQLFALTERSFNYQGMLLDANNNPVTAFHHVTIKIYDAPVGGNVIHTETFSTVFEKGYFSVVLGSGMPAESALTSEKQYWLDITLENAKESRPRVAYIPMTQSITGAKKHAVTSQDHKNVETTQNATIALKKHKHIHRAKHSAPVIHYPFSVYYPHIF